EEVLTRQVFPWALAQGLELAPSDAAGLAAYGALLLDENERVNLTGCRTPEELATRHLADTVPFLIELAETPACEELVDLGSGGGLPGIPLAILQPARPILLVESTGKKCRFLERACKELGLVHVSVACARAEDLGRAAAFRERFAVATARACAAFPVACEYALPLLRREGMLLAPRGPAAAAEAGEAARALTLLGGEVVATRPYQLPQGPAVFGMVRVRKVRPTPSSYPRPAAAIVRRPL
ncbi:MAG: 16S rRNA (guanine(527)-N(7))-methyltransferase RsmG, partial [Candidatus Riflebacteria bacterium]|nr:16S rRNA (guanine(527)-N(7))-methyltransferase RsmG [Candidatus Riflebacteria bacterium]